MFNKIKRDSISLILIQGANYIIPLIIIPLLSRRLGVSELGHYNLFFSIAAYLAILIEFGFYLSASKEITVNIKDKEKINSILTNTLFCRFMIYLFAIIIVSFFVTINKIDEFNCKLIFLFFIGFSNVFYLQWFFQGIEHVAYVSKVSVIIRVLTIPFYFLFVKTENDLNVAILIQILSSCIVSAILFVKVINEYSIKISYLKLNIISSTFKKGWPLFLSALTINVSAASSPILISYFSNIEQVGYYATADKIKGAIIGFIVVLIGVIYPRINRMLVENEIEAFRFIKKIILYNFFITLLLLFVVYFFAPFIINIAFGDNYSDSVTILKYMALLIMLVPLNICFGNYLLLPIGDVREFSIIPIIKTVSFLFFSIVLITRYGAIGCVFSLIISEIICLLLFVFVAYKKGYIRRLILS